MKKMSIISILFVLIASQIITQKVSAQSNYHDYSDFQKTDIFLDDFNDNWHVWPYIRDGDTWTGKIENGYMLWESKGKSSISQEKVIPINENLYSQFPPDVKAGIDAAHLELEQWYRGWDAAFWREIRADVEKKGIKWYELPPDEAQRWWELLTKASVTWVMERTPDVGRQLFGIVEKVTGRKVLK